MSEFIKGILMGGGFSLLGVFAVLYFCAYILPGDQVKQFFFGLASGSTGVFTLFVLVLLAFAKAWPKD